MPASHLVHVLPSLTGRHTDVPLLQIDYYCRLDCLWKKKFKKEHEEFETMENVNRLLLENVLPAHVAAHFIGDKLNEVWGDEGLVPGWEAWDTVQSGWGRELQVLAQCARGSGAPAAPRKQRVLSAGRTQASASEAWVWVWPRTRYLTSLGLDFCICKTGLTVPS